MTYYLAENQSCGTYFASGCRIFINSSSNTLCNELPSMSIRQLPPSDLPWSLMEVAVDCDPFSDAENTVPCLGCDPSMRGRQAAAELARGREPSSEDAAGVLKDLR